MEYLCEDCMTEWHPVMRKSSMYKISGELSYPAGSYK